MIKSHIPECVCECENLWEGVLRLSPGCYNPLLSAASNCSSLVSLHFHWVGEGKEWILPQFSFGVSVTVNPDPDFIFPHFQIHSS